MLVYLSDVHPEHRDMFVKVMGAYGVEGAIKLRPRSRASERITAALPGNLCYDTPAGLVAMPSHPGSSRQDADPFYLAGRAESSVAFSSMGKRDYTYSVPAYAIQEHRPSSNKKSSSKIVTRVKKRSNSSTRYVFTGSYARVLSGIDISTRESRNKWLDLSVEINEDRDYRHWNGTPVYVHGVLFDGVDFNVGEHNKTLAEKFVPLPLGNGVTIKINKVRRAKAHVGLGSKIKRVYGYVVTDHFVFTNFPNHQSWVDSQPVIETKESTLVENWRKVILRTTKTEKDSIAHTIEGLNASLLEEERKFGQLKLLIDAAEANTDQRILANIEKLRTIPEIESLTFTSSSFVFTTKNMMATRESTGEERYCGKFEIQISIEGMARIRNIASPKSDYRNPHGSCLGSFSRLFASALHVFDYYAFVLTAMEYYRMLDKDHDHIWNDKHDMGLPDSKDPPTITHVSTWQDLVGSYPTNEEDGDGDYLEQTLFVGYVPPEDDEEIDGEDDDY